MMRWLPVCLLVMALFAPCAASAQEAANFPLKPLLHDLAVTHERIQAAQAGYESSQHMIGKAQSAWYPRLDATTEAGYEVMDKPLQTSTDYWRNVEGLRASQLLYDFGGASGNIDLYKGLSGEMKARMNQTVQDVLVQGVTAYLLTIRARETLKYAFQSEENIKRLSGMQEALVARGAGLSYEELQVKAQLSGSQSYRVTQERALVT
ncbi:MAG TPA: transporter, partial [Desulfovibrio sp.]|nr:transporter [Desulfovibrio sp.]